MRLLETTNYSEIEKWSPERIIDRIKENEPDFSVDQIPGYDSLHFTNLKKIQLINYLKTIEGRNQGGAALKGSITEFLNFDLDIDNPRFISDLKRLCTSLFTERVNAYIYNTVLGADLGITRGKLGRTFGLALPQKNLEHWSDDVSRDIDEHNYVLHHVRLTRSNEEFNENAYVLVSLRYHSGLHAQMREAFKQYCVDSVLFKNLVKGLYLGQIKTSYWTKPYMSSWYIDPDSGDIRRDASHLNIKFNNPAGLSNADFKQDLIKFLMRYSASDVDAEKFLNALNESSKSDKKGQTVENVRFQQKNSAFMKAILTELLFNDAYEEFLVGYVKKIDDYALGVTLKVANTMKDGSGSLPNSDLITVSKKDFKDIQYRTDAIKVVQMNSSGKYEAVEFKYDADLTAQLSEGGVHELAFLRDGVAKVVKESLLHKQTVLTEGSSSWDWEYNKYNICNLSRDMLPDFNSLDEKELAGYICRNYGSEALRHPPFYYMPQSEWGDLEAACLFQSFGFPNNKLAIATYLPCIKQGLQLFRRVGKKLSPPSDFISWDKFIQTSEWSKYTQEYPKEAKILQDYIEMYIRDVNAARPHPSSREYLGETAARELLSIINRILKIGWIADVVPEREPVKYDLMRTALGGRESTTGLKRQKLDRSSQPQYKQTAKAYGKMDIDPFHKFTRED